MNADIYEAITERVEEIVDSLIDEHPLVEIMKVDVQEGVAYVHAKGGDTSFYVYSEGGSESSHTHTNLEAVPLHYRHWFVANAPVH